MRIACPACNAAYQVPDERLRDGRVVRCARCGTEWAPIAAAPEPDAESRAEPEAEPQAAPEPTPEPTPEPEPRAMALEDDPVPTIVSVGVPAPVERPRRKAPVLALAWVASLAIVTAALVALYVGRERVMAVWPPSARGFAAIGLAR